MKLEISENTSMYATAGSVGSLQRDFCLDVDQIVLHLTYRGWQVLHQCIPVCDWLLNGQAMDTNKEVELTTQKPLEWKCICRVPGSLTIVLSNDCGRTSIPISKFIVDDFNLRFRSCGQHTSLVNCFQVRASYFNSFLVVWEPLLDPCSMSIRSAESLHPLLEHKHSQLSLRCLDELNFNITDNLVNAALESLSLLTQARDPKAPVDNKLFFPFRFANETEFAVIVTPVIRAGLVKTPSFGVAPNASIPFDVEVSDGHLRLRLSFDDKQNDLLLNVKLSNKAKQIFTLPRGDANTNRINNLTVVRPS